MKKRVILVILLSSLINIHPVNASDEIALKSRRFTPAKGITAATREKIEAIQGRAHVLIQLERIPTIKEKKELEAKGIRLLSYIPNKAWFASIAPDKLSEVAALSAVRAISEISHEDKISPHIIGGDFFWDRVKDGKADFIVEFFKDVSLKEAERVIEKHNVYVIGRVTSLNALVVTARIEQSVDLALEESVKWIEQELPLEALNNGTRTAIDVDTVQAPPYNLDGTGIDVLVYDAGLVDDTHDDFGDRVTLGEDGFANDHATHVAGTVGGDGMLSGGTYRGMAPGVDIISYYVLEPCNWWLEPPECLYDDADQMEDMDDNFNEGITTYGVDIGTASVGAQPARWGISCEFEGDYSPFAQLIDTIIYNRSIPITWAAANERGYETCGITYNTISPTSTGKNAIIVGATNSNDDSMTDFSSWGPTDDGRIKPDVVAPGCQVGGDWGITSTVPVDTYDSGCGTSMATPAVAGSVALMLEDWRDNHIDEPDPLPSTIKAILIQTAKDLGNTGPDYSHGYGKINVKNAIDLIREDVNNNVILEDSIIEQDDKDYFAVDVPDGQSELKITLVWDDYPGDPAAANALVNDLDLIVKNPNGTRYYPWILNPSNPADPATRGEDHLNNVEQVYVDNPASGIWLIEISGNNVPEPVQEYSLVSNNIPLLEAAKNEQLLNKVDDVNDGDSVLPGDEVTYTIYYANPVTDTNDPNYIGPLTDVQIIDYLPKEVDFNNPFDPGCDLYEHTYTWDIGTLSPGDSNSVTLTVIVNELAEPLGTITNLCILDANEIGLITSVEVTNVNSWNPGVIYVDMSAGGANTGMSWDNAYTDMQDALGRARAGCGSEIRAAKGTYRPAEVVDWSATFELVDGVAMYGGFPHGGGARDPNAHPTILTGDINGDGSSDVQDVVTALNVGQTTTIDGFTITKGDWSGIWCDVNGSPTIAHNTIKENNYDGIDCNDNSGSTIIGCTIEDNGKYGINCLPNSSPTITRSRIKNNGDDGIYYENSEPNIINCIIEENSDNGIYSENSLHATITNNIIRGNNSVGIYCQEIGEGIEINIRNNWIHNNGDGIYIYNALVEPAPAVIRHNTIADNAGYGINSLWAVDANVTNCIIWNNTSGQFYSDNGTYNVTFSCIEGDPVYTGTGNINDDPCFVDDANDNYHLSCDSPCIDTGDPNFTPDANETDIDGEPRLTGDRVDMGADEFYWSEADFNNDEIVNFIDYAMFINTWQTDPNDPEYNYIYDLDPNNSPDYIDYFDLVVFCDNWLWEAAWAHPIESMMMRQSMGQGLGLTEGFYPSVTAKQPQITRLDIEELLKWLAEIWLDPEVRKAINEDAWLKFIESVAESSKEERQN